ncbi:MAG: hypothetical protein HKO62_12205, partial [Gammaproteobacteria bacterium]|nr:hypothetical protein [Gammaproteobacteria bacterium]
MPLGREVTGSRATSRTTIENSRAPRRGIAGVVDRLARSEWKALAATAWPALACLLPACAHGDPVETKLTPAVSVSFDVAGSSVAIDGDTAIVGAPTFQVEGNVGSAFVFTRNADVWGEQDELIAADGAEADLVGSSVSVDGDTAVLGAPGQRLSV